MQKEKDRLSDWIDQDDIAIVRYGDNLYAQPQLLRHEFAFIAERVSSIYSGIMAGQWVRDKFIPAPALALSELLSESVIRQPLDRENAIRFLQRKEMSIEPGKQGWQLATCEGLGLGWMNALKNRINNYYPKEWRILKDQP